MKIFIQAMLGLVILFFGFSFYRTWVIQNTPNQKLFVSGKVPDPGPDGFYKGSAEFPVGAWEGKTFDREKSAGLNVLGINNKRLERVAFKTSVGKGIQDKGLDVLIIDYNIPENLPLFRPVLDEIVEVEPGKYLGKVHLRLIPNLYFTYAFFNLEKDQTD